MTRNYVNSLIVPLRRGFDYFYGMYGGFADYFTHISAEPESPDNAAFDLHEHYKENITSSKIF